MGFALPNQIQGQAIGTSIAVHDSTALANLSIQGMAIGTQVYNTTLGSIFVLTASTAALVTNQVVAVLGISGLRWILLPTGGALAGLTLAQSRLALAPEYTATVSGASVQTLTLSGLNGNVDGDYEIYGNVAIGHSAATYQLTATGLGNTSYNGYVINQHDGPASAAGNGFWALFAGGGTYPSGAGNISTNLAFQGTLRTLGTGLRVISLDIYASTTPIGAVLTGYSSDTTDNITGLVITSSQTDGIAAGSFIRATALGRS